MKSTQRKPSTANDGFFQTIPIIRNQFYDDASLQRALNCKYCSYKSHVKASLTTQVFLPKAVIEAVTPELAKFGDEILSKRIFDWVTDAERNIPYVRGGGRDAFGRRTSELVVSEGWKNLQNFGIENGYVMPVSYLIKLILNVSEFRIVATGYEQKYSESTRVVQMLK
jgi:hypothetical protein